MNQPSNTRVDVVVAGAGLGGLVAALTSARLGQSVVVIDSSTTGGRAATDHIGAYRMNRGPHAFAIAGKALPILKGLGINCTGKRPPIQRLKYWVADSTIGAFSPSLLGGKGLAQFGRVLTQMTIDRSKDFGSSMTVAEYLDEKDVLPRARQAIEAMIRLSTYAHCPDLISVDVAMQTLASGSRGVRYVHGGWGSIAEQLRTQAKLAGVTFVEQKVTGVTETEGEVSIVITGGNEYQAESLICALGNAKATASLLNIRPDSWHLDAPTSETTHLDLGLSAVPKHRIVLGLERPMYAITHHPPARLAPPNGAVVHLMRYIHPHETLSVEAERAELNAAAEVIGVAPSHRVEERFLHRMSTFSATPTPKTGGMAGRPPTQVPDSQRMFVCGDWVGPGWLAEAVTQSATSASQQAFFLHA